MDWVTGLDAWVQLLAWVLTTLAEELRSLTLLIGYKLTANPWACWTLALILLAVNWWRYDHRK